MLIGIGFQHAPHDEDLRIAGSEVEVIALPFRGMQLDRVTGNAPARGDGIGSQGLRRVLGIGVKLDGGGLPLFVRPAIDERDALHDDSDSKPHQRHGFQPTAKQL